MLTLVAGLLLFLGPHSVRVFAEGWRRKTIAQVGEKTWKGAYSLVSIAGFVLIVVGFGLARQNPMTLWPPAPVWLRHLGALLTLVAFVLVTAAYVPRNGIKARVGDPMILGVGMWAFGHLLANNGLRDAVLFGAFLAWAAVDFWSASKRPHPDAGAKGEGARTVVTVVVGAVAWAVFAFWLHAKWIGVRPFA